MPAYVFTVVVLLTGLLGRRSNLLTWQFIFCLFGAAAALALPNGATITPGNLFLAVFAIRTCKFVELRRLCIEFPRAGVWLSLTVLWGVLGALFIPRMLQGQLLVLALDRDGLRPFPSPLHPVSGNLTQSVYAIANLLAYICFSIVMRTPGQMSRLQRATLILSSLDIAAGLLQLLEHHLHFPGVLQYVRTASYALFDTYEGAGGLMRIQGTFSEASGFAIFTIPLLAFNARLWMLRQNVLWSGTNAAGLVSLLLLSTSSTAYFGLASYGGMLAILLVRRAMVQSVPRLGQIALMVLGALALLSASVALDAPFLAKLGAYFEQTIFGKLESNSGLERGLWNTYAWLSFVESQGLGVGLGSARASSHLLVLLSNLGVPGTLLYALFIGTVLRTHGAFEAGSAVSEAAKHAVAATLLTSLASSGVFDLGIVFYAFTAAAGASTSDALTQLNQPQRQNARWQQAASINPVAPYRTRLPLQRE